MPIVVKCFDMPTVNVMEHRTSLLASKNTISTAFSLSKTYSFPLVYRSLRFKGWARLHLLTYHINCKLQLYSSYRAYILRSCLPSRYPSSSSSSLDSCCHPSTLHFTVSRFFFACALFMFVYFMLH